MGNYDGSTLLEFVRGRVFLATCIVLEFALLLFVR